MTNIHEFYNGLLFSPANDFIPTAREYQQRIVSNPAGLPSAIYKIWMDIGDPNDLRSISQFALNVTGAQDYWTRIPVGRPNLWGPWFQISGGGGGPGVTSWTGQQGTTRTGAVGAIVGDYNASMVTNAPAGGISALDVQAAINELDVEKISLGAANMATDILVALGPGDNYAPSGTILPGQIGALTIGQANGVTQTPDGFALSIKGNGVMPINGLASANMTGDPPNTPGYFCLEADYAASPNFGQGGNAQAGLLITARSGLPNATGAAGAYQIFAQRAGVGTPDFFVDANGHVGITPLVTAAVNAISVDASNMLTQGVSLRKFKENIEDAQGTEIIYKIPVRQYNLISDVDKIPKIGAIVEEVLEAGAHPSYFFYNCEDRHQQLDQPVNLNDRSFLFALIKEVQKLKNEVEELKLRM